MKLNDSYIINEGDNLLTSIDYETPSIDEKIDIKPKVKNANANSNEEAGNGIK